MIDILEEVYIWLSIIDNLDYITYINLIRKFHSTINIYNYSKDKIIFEKYLIQNNIVLNEKLKSSLLNPNKKITANKIYNYFKSKNIHIIPFNSKYYPLNLKNIFSPPLCIFVNGNIENINKEKIYVYESNNLSEYASRIKKDIYEKIVHFNDILVLNKNIKVMPINLEKEYENIVNYRINSNLLSIYYNNKISEIKNIEVVSGLVDLLIIPEADYTKEIAIIVDSMLENGKNVVIFPNEIYNKNAFFSNYLIKNGAYMVTSFNEIKSIIKKYRY